MKSLALHGAVRRWLTRLHRWSGLVIMACMVFDRAHVDPMIDRLHYSLSMNNGGLWAGSGFSPRERIAS